MTVVVLFSVTASCRDDFLPLLAKGFDAQRDDVADIEKLWRLHAGADAGRRAGGDNVARPQGHELRDVGNALGHRKNHGRGRSGLAALAIDIQPHRQLLHVRYFILGDEPWADRTEGVMRLALGPLTEALDLKVALGYVIADAISGNVFQRVSLGYVFGGAADNGGDFDFPVELGRAAWLFDRIVWPAERGVRLEEEDRFGRELVAGLLGVVAIIQSDGNDFGNAGDQSATPRFALRLT